MIAYFIIGITTLLAAAYYCHFLAYRTQVGIATRQSASSNKGAASSSYIESSGSTTKFSCSFVEFDGRGDFLDFNQHQECLEIISTLSATQTILLVIYCHGWKNTSQSIDVLRFNRFLDQLSTSRLVEESGFRVHGIYLSWRGNVVKPYVDFNGGNSEWARETFGEDIVSQKATRRHRRLLSPIEQLSYWSRKHAAEHQVSGLAVTRAAFTYSAAAKGMQQRKFGADNRTLVIGHSFGALMLEQSLLQGAVGNLISQWVWNPKSDDERQNIPPTNNEDGATMASKSIPRSAKLPFDLILLLNSAAPSIYALQLRSFLSAHVKALEIQNAPHSDAPVVVSITSTADGATRYMHPIGNALSRFSPSMKRNYTERLLKTSSRGQQHAPVHQSYFYRKTPGHNPMLVNRWLSREPSTTAENVGYAPERPLSQSSWLLSNACPSSDPTKVAGHDVDPWIKSAYWIVECGKNVISSHNDVWNKEAMAAYMALFTMANRESDREQQFSTYDQDEELGTPPLG